MHKYSCIDDNDDDDKQNRGTLCYDIVLIILCNLERFKNTFVYLNLYSLNLNEDFNFFQKGFGCECAKYKVSSFDLRCRHFVLIATR